MSPPTLWTQKGNGFVHNLTPITALGGQSAQVDSHGGVTCTEVPNVALASFAARLGREKQAQKVLEQALGTAIPDVARLVEGDLTAFWMGPDQWMVEAPLTSREGLARELAELASGVASVTEQTDAWTRFDLTGECLEAVLELLCQMNIRAMTGGEAQRGAIHHLGCFVLCRSVTHFSIYGPRASAGSLHHAIISAMKSAS